MQARSTEDVTVLVGDDEVAVSRRRAGHSVVAKVLGREHSPGVERLYLDSLVHRPGEDCLGVWEVTGAISTVLTRRH